MFKETIRVQTKNMLDVFVEKTVLSSTKIVQEVLKNTSINTLKATCMQLPASCALGRRRVFFPVFFMNVRMNIRKNE